MECFHPLNYQPINAEINLEHHASSATRGLNDTYSYPKPFNEMIRWRALGATSALQGRILRRRASSPGTMLLAFPKDKLTTIGQYVLFAVTTYWQTSLPVVVTRWNSAKLE